VTRRPQPLLVATVTVAVLFVSPALAQVRGSARGLGYGPPDKAAMDFVSDCLGSAPPHPLQFYSHGGWYPTEDLRQQLLDHPGTVEAVAMVWKLAGQPRAVYQWNHDGEFNRDLVACLDSNGKVTRSQSHYTPGDSEPDQRWIYIHTLTTAGHHGNLVGSGRFTDRQGHPMGHPQLTPEDQDFIAGERIYHRWSDFDFAGLVGKQQ
jgi:hypothetical protein